MYEDAYAEASNQARKATGYKQIRLHRAKELYRMLKAAAPAVKVDIATLLTAEDCKRAMLIPLAHRTKDQRIAMWTADFKSDKTKLTPHVEQSRHVLGVR